MLTIAVFLLHNLGLLSRMGIMSDYFIKSYNNFIYLFKACLAQRIYLTLHLVFTFCAGIDTRIFVFIKHFLFSSLAHSQHNWAKYIAIFTRKKETTMIGYFLFVL